MKLLGSINGFKPIFTQNSLNGIMLSFYSTETLPSNPYRDTLYGRISQIGDPKVSVSPVLDQWIDEGKTVIPNALRSMIKQLRTYRRFKHALEVSRWMSERRYMILFPGDIAVRLDLIARVHGLEEAENYFINIPKQSRILPVYVAFINCYAREKSFEKAEALVQKVKELGFPLTPLAYSSILLLYSKMEQHEKIEALVEEMDEKGIPLSKFTYSNWLNAYAASPNVNKMEKVIKRMEGDPRAALDRSCYTVAADGYLKAGLIDKALKMLKKSEGLIQEDNRKVGYNILLTLYARAGRKDELYRIWNSYKSSKRVYNAAYVCMIISLLKLDDIAGAEKIFEDWESRCTNYDFRIPNLLIAAYCDNGLLEKAESIISKVIENGNKPVAVTWERMAIAYLKDNKTAKAIDALNKAIAGSERGWKLGHLMSSACLEYFKSRGKVEGLEEFVELLGFSDASSADAFERLLDFLSHIKPESNSVNVVCEDDVVDNEEHDMLEAK
ncbi:hypothetical protein Scep_028371 [Stephania cephalantha]|uniref:Pentatricopeptide repeat-containing protein n=1 Tax=Stephania cephalantha TaxID=152367 RepID=A0AAP0EI83_9MAGN